MKLKRTTLNFVIVFGISILIFALVGFFAARYRYEGKEAPLAFAGFGAFIGFLFGMAVSSALIERDPNKPIAM